jgi:hypothetical protein
LGISKLIRTIILKLGKILTPASSSHCNIFIKSLWYSF